MSDVLSLVVPLYNEEPNVRPVAEALVDALRAGGVPFELILVDNGSADGTAREIDALRERHPEVRKAVVAVNQGYGWGVLQGLAAAEGDIVGFMGGDGQTDPADVVRVYRKLVDEGLPLAKARRVRRGDGPVRLAVTVLANAIFCLAFGLRTFDVNGTPKMMRRDLYRSLGLESKDWFLDAEIMIRCTRRRVPYGEVPVVFHPRARGASNVKWATILEFLRNTLRAWREPAR